ncbi:MAG TPA: signal peptide peptidase SppA, partial [Spirochaetota bacterium]|nr:signal peptide peptidase SppA [Spirochaetota bacterium]
FRYGKGFFFRNMIGFGLSHSFSTSRNRLYKGYYGLSWGLLFRPVRYVSMAFVMNDAWAEINGNRLRWKETYSISVRPYFERITLSLDMIRGKGKAFRDTNIKFTADVRIPWDITLFFSLDRYLNIAYGLTVPIQFRSIYGPGVDLRYNRTANQDAAPDINGFTVAVRLARSRSGLTMPGPKNFVKITFDGTMHEIEKKSFWGTNSTVFYDLVKGIRSISEDTGIDGLIIHIGKPGIGFARIQELRNELKLARKHGKKVYAVMTEPGNAAYYLATAADKIYFTPNSPFFLTGLSAQVYFFKGLMDKVGVRFEPVNRGRYKSFSDPFTREHMSDEFRENMASLLEDLNGQFVGDISADRGISRTVLDELFTRGSLTPEDAVKSRLVDRVGYPEDIMDEIGQSASVVSLSAYRRRPVREYAWSILPRVALVVIEGNIVSGRGFNTGLFRSIGNEAYREALEKAFSDPVVRAVVIRINSGGGSAAASDYMLNSLSNLKKKYGKPVVFSFGNIAASGGYYAACTGDRIYSNNGTITGSIGVVFGKITLEELYRKLGISKDVIKMSEFADIFSESRRLTDKEKKLLQEGVDFTYDRFTGMVVRARGISAEEVSRVAEGRVFTGAQAIGNRLVDEAGGIMTALEYAAHVAGISGQYDVVKYPSMRGPLFDPFDIPDIQQLAEQVRGLIRSVEYLNLKDEKALYLFPYRVEIE